MGIIGVILTGIATIDGNTIALMGFATANIGALILAHIRNRIQAAGISKRIEILEQKTDKVEETLENITGLDKTVGRLEDALVKMDATSESLIRLQERHAALDHKRKNIESAGVQMLEMLTGLEKTVAIMGEKIKK